MSNPLAFPTMASDADLKIDLPRHGAKEDGSSASHRRQSSHQTGDKSALPSAASTWQHHPRQPGPSSDSYFPGGGGSALPKTPKHTRNASASGSALPMSLNLAAAQASAADGGYGQGPPSPSTLTDVILGLHSTLYSGKRRPQEVSDMVSRYYESNAVFESPLLSAHGRDQIANQFIMAFALPGMDVKSELRDVICSDFEFDGTRAGIIDHAVTVNFFPSLFGTASEPPSFSDGASGFHSTQRAGSMAPQIGSGSAYPQSAIPVTPHPFIDYNSAFSRIGQQSHPHSPTTPFSTSSVMWGGSRPHTPGHSGMRPLTNQTQCYNTPPSVNGDDGELTSTLVPNTSSYVDANTLDQELALRPAIPADALTPHWKQDGFGRGSFRGLLWSLFHPRAVLKSLFCIQLRVMSRLEFNDAGLIVRHEDTWGLRETIEGAVPFASLVYSIERRLVGFIVSWAVAKGFKVSSALLLKAIPGKSPQEDEYHISQQEAESMYQPPHSQLHNHLHQHAHLHHHQHHSSHHHHHHHAFNPQQTPLSASAHNRPFRDFYTISRSRATSPTRFRFSSNNEPKTGIVTGTRSRARSLVGQHSVASSRAMSTDNLVLLGQQSAEPTAHRRNAELPPDSSAKFRERTAKRLEGGRTSSAPPTAPAHPTPTHDAEYNGNLAHMWDNLDGYSHPTRDDLQTPFKAPDQDPQ